MKANDTEAVTPITLLLLRNDDMLKKPRFNKNPLVMGVVEVHSVHSQLSSSGTPFQFQLPNSHLPTRITPPETLLEAKETLWVIPSNKIGEDRLQCIFKSSGS